MDQEQLLASYEAAAKTTREMLLAARATNWERFSELETRCADQIRRVEPGTSRTPLSPLQRNRKIDLISRILADDREIRLLTEPWMSELSSLLGPASVMRNHAEAWGEVQAG